MIRKYTPTVDRRRQLSPGFLEDALDEVTRGLFISVAFLSLLSVALICSYSKYSFCFSQQGKII